eukprot:RCo033198
MEEFATLHAAQLRGMGLPPVLWPEVFRKLTLGLVDEPLFLAENQAVRYQGREGASVHLVSHLWVGQGVASVGALLRDPASANWLKPLLLLKPSAVPTPSSSPNGELPREENGHLSTPSGARVEQSAGGSDRCEPAPATEVEGGAR